jgi:hypothetical protein
MSSSLTKTNSDKLWEEIKDLELNLYGMPRKVSDEFTKVDVSKDMVYLKNKNMASTAALEDALMSLNKDYALETVDMYLVISKKAK